MRRGRDRRGRGVRGPLSPPQVPLARSRAERFDDLVLDAVDRLEGRWAQQLEDVEFAVDEVPPTVAAEAVPVPTDDADRVPLAEVVPGRGGRATRIVVYRRPLEARAPDGRDLAALVHDVVVEQVAELLGVEPETVDPGYAGD